MKKTLEQLAVEQGRPLERIIPPVVDRWGVVGGAKKLGYSPSTISGWLKNNGYIGRMTWVKKTTPAERADIDAAADRVNARRDEQGLPTLEEEEFS